MSRYTKTVVPAPSSSPKQRIGLCGFNAYNSIFQGLGLLRQDDFEYQFFAIDDQSFSVEDFDGVIFASGCFERINLVETVMGTYHDLTWDHPSLMLREKQAHNLVENGGWLCFLTSNLIKSVQGPNYQIIPADESDLSKTIIRSLNVRWANPDRPKPHLDCVQNEFEAYISKHGIGYSQFLVNKGDEDVRILAKSNEGIYSFVAIDSVFFLPFQFAKAGKDQIIDAIKLSSKAIFEYRLKNVITIPEWLNELKFSEEKILSEKEADLNRQLEDIGAEKESYKSKKSILISSGTPLVKAVKDIMTDYIGLPIKAEEKYIDDFLITNANGIAEFVVEVKGVNRGVSRDHINQVDTHRERLEIDATTRGVLIINDNMTVIGIQERRKISVHPDIKKHANNQNTKIVRSIDLLDFLITHEQSSIEDRAKAMKDWLVSNN